MADDQSDVQYSSGESTPSVSPRRPYSIVFVGDLSAPDALGKLTAVDKQDFADLLKRACPKPALAVADPLGSGPEWEFQLAFDSLKAFEPAGLLSQIPAGRWRLGLRDKVNERRQGAISEDDLEAALDAAAAADSSLAWLKQAGPSPGSAGPPPAAQPAAGGGSILDLVDEPSESDRVTADVERLAARAGDRDAKISGTEGGRLTEISNRLNLELGAIADALLKHPDVRRIECAWRGLKFLVDRLDFREGARLSVLSATREQAVEHFVDHVVTPAFDGGIPTPGLVVFDYPFVSTPADVAVLDELAQHAAGLPVPVVLPLDAQFFNIKRVSLLKSLPNLSGLVDAWQFAKWRGLRDQIYARWLVPVLGNFILRAPYEPVERARDFTYRETISSQRDLLWAGGHLAMAVCAARSHVTHGWPTRMFGAEAGKIDNLPIVQNPKDEQKPWGPGDLFLPDRRIDELPAVGVNLLQSIKNKDHCYLLGGVSAARPKQTADVGQQQALLEISLPYQQFTNIAGAYLCDQLPDLRGQNGEQIQKRLLFGLQNLMSLDEKDAEDSILVGVGPDPQDSSRTVVQVRVTPPARIVPGGLHVDFGFPIPS